MSSSTLRLVTATDYFESLSKTIPAAKKRIVIHAMVVLWQTYTESLAPLLQDALDRGVEVRIVGDMYSKLTANMPSFVRGDHGQRWGHTIAINSELRSSGANVTYVGKLGLNPFKQRCHSKITIIDDLVYTFGGVNFYSGAFTFHDYMLETTDSKLADRLYSLVCDIEKFPRMTDTIEKLNKHNTLLFDGGTPGSSAIYDAACAAAANAKKVYYVSQMCPSGRLAKFITATDNECYFVRPTQADTPSNLALIFDKARFGVTNRYKGKRYIHAKFILTEDKDGTKHIISGSNNFSWRGIAYGTKEIAVHSTDPVLWQVFYDYMQREIVSETA
ncbi:MAG TPA: phospholipase D-like domain-containing protein [Candidatus Saccharimonadales bacterium]|nr:phospholipase D-like domain-containing protein [Candidatus Saccharimonadales bacterium]